MRAAINSSSQGQDLKSNMPTLFDTKTDYDRLPREIACVSDRYSF